MRAHWIYYLLCVTTLFVNQCICSPGPSICRCRPRDPCWPTSTEWSAFNRSVNGHLQRVRPVAYVCHGDTYDQASCDTVKANDAQCLWRISQPGALIDTNWESLPDENEECYIHSPHDIPCKQGRIPLYAVVAETVEEVQTAVRFAKDRNLRIVVRNTGHGVWRSSGLDSLQINLSKLKSINHTTEFIPQGGTGSLGQAVTLGAATLAYEVSAAGAKHGFIVLVGTCSTVGIAGGFLQGGGLSYLAPIYGTPADNALEFVVVTAEGDLVVANDFQHQDLFWALRGGGGGTFGIAVSTTVRAYPDVPVVDVWVNATNTNSTQGPSTTWAATREILRMYPALNDRTHTAIIGVVPNLPPGHPAGVYLTSRAVNVPPALVDAQFAPLRARLDALGINHTYSATFHPSLAALMARLESIDIAGDGVIEGSVFVSEALHQAADGPDRIVDVLARSAFGPHDKAGIVLTGGRVKDNKGIVDTASRPSWRDALSLLWVRWRMSSAPSPAEQSAYRWYMTMVQMPLLRELEGRRMGSYVNIADPDEPNFQDAYWGENYPRLRRIKRDWDADGMFIVRHGVGSEEWDEEGLCRIA